MFKDHEGDFLHDTPQAYADWGDALKHLTLSVQVEHASSSGYVHYETYRTTDNEIEVIHQKGKGKPREETVDGLVINNQRIDHGLVRFRVYRPDKKKDKN